jgi:hypothetical protein
VVVKNLLNIMKIRFFLFVIVFATQLIPASSGLSQDTTLIHFQMKDQFDYVWSHNDFLGHVTIIVGSDRKGSQYNEIWSFAIYDSLIKYGLTDSVKFLAVADIRGVPSPFKKFVKKKFPKEPHRWIILDWEGEFAQAYHFIHSECNLILIDRSGRTLYQFSVKKLDQKKLDLILKKIYALFPSPP